MTVILHWMHLNQRAIAQNDRDKIPYHMVGHIARFEPSTTQAGKKLVKKGAIFRNVLDYEITNLALVWLRLLQLRMGTSTKNMPNYQAF